MSQICYRDSGIKLDALIKQSSEVIEVSYTGTNELLKEVIMPKETHHDKEYETVYREFCGIYTVHSILRSSGVISTDCIRIYRSSSYNEYLVRLYHEKGISKSLIKEVYVSKYKIDDAEHFIAFLTLHQNYEDVFFLNGSEGLEFNIDMI